MTFNRPTFTPAKHTHGPCNPNMHSEYTFKNKQQQQQRHHNNNKKRERKKEEEKRPHLNSFFSVAAVAFMSVQRFMAIMAVVKVIYKTSIDQRLS